MQRFTNSKMLFKISSKPYIYLLNVITFTSWSLTNKFTSVLVFVCLKLDTSTTFYQGILIIIVQKN